MAFGVFAELIVSEQSTLRKVDPVLTAIRAEQAWTRNLLRATAPATGSCATPSFGSREARAGKSPSFSIQPDFSERIHLLFHRKPYFDPCKSANELPTFNWQSNHLHYVSFYLSTSQGLHSKRVVFPSPDSRQRTAFHSVWIR